MTLGVVSITTAMLIAIVSSFFAFRDDKKRPTLAGYIFVFLSIAACGIAINEHLTSEMEKKDTAKKLADSEKRELEVLKELDQSQKKQQKLLEKVEALQQEVEKDRIKLSDIHRPAENLDIEIQYKFDTTHPKISALIDELFVYADKSEKQDDQFSLSDNKETLVIHDPNWLINFTVVIADCKKIPDICLEYNGQTMHLISALGIQGHMNDVQFYLSSNLHNKGIFSLSDEDKYASYSTRAKVPDLYSQITIHKKVHRQFAYDIKQSYRRVFNNNMGGKDDIEDAYARVMLLDAIPGFEVFYSEVIVNVFDEEIITRSFSLDTDEIVEIEAGDPIRAGSSYFFIPHR